MTHESNVEDFLDVPFVPEPTKGPVTRILPNVRIAQVRTLQIVYAAPTSTGFFERVQSGLDSNCRALFVLIVLM